MWKRRIKMNWGHSHSAFAFDPISSCPPSLGNELWSNVNFCSFCLFGSRPHDRFAGFDIVQKLMVLFHDAIDLLQPRGGSKHTQHLFPLHFYHGLGQPKTENPSYVSNGHGKHLLDHAWNCCAFSSGRWDQDCFHPTSCHTVTRFDAQKQTTWRSCCRGALKHFAQLNET